MLIAKYKKTLASMILGTATLLAVQPRAILLDEPLTALDAKLRDTLRLEIDTLLRKLGITAIYVTHDQSEAMALGDRIVVMNHGCVAQVGKPKEIYHQPTSRFDAEFIGTMNRLQGSVTDETFLCKAGMLSEISLPLDTKEVLFRPHDVHIIDEDKPGHLTGTVSAAFFLGDCTRLLVDVGETDALIVESDVRKMFRRGDTIKMQIDPRGLLVLQ